MRIVIALGGNALLQRGQPMTAENQRANIRLAAERIASIAPGNEIVIAHGNGPQVGLLALQDLAYEEVDPYPLDVLGAETEAMIGYVVLLISFPLEMSTWAAPRGVGGHVAGFGEALGLIFGGHGDHVLLDAVSSATPLDTLHTQLGLGQTVAASLPFPDYCRARR